MFSESQKWPFFGDAKYISATKMAAMLTVTCARYVFFNPRPHQQHCRMLQVERYFRQSRMCFYIVAVYHVHGNSVERNLFRPLEKVETN